MKRHYEEHGYTEGCDGCGRLSAGMEPRAHSNKCRKRMEEAMRSTEKGRKWMEKANDRIGEWMEEKYNEEGKKSETVGAAKPEGRK